ncbi:putative PEP-binding protein [Escherichia coli]
MACRAYLLRSHRHHARPAVRAILRASAFGKLRIMFPMIISIRRLPAA